MNRDQTAQTRIVGRPSTAGGGGRIRQTKQIVKHNKNRDSLDLDDEFDFDGVRGALITPLEDRIDLEDDDDHVISKRENRKDIQAQGELLRREKVNRLKSGNVRGGLPSYQQGAPHLAPHQMGNSVPMQHPMMAYPGYPPVNGEFGSDQCGYRGGGGGRGGQYRWLLLGGAF